MLKFTKDHEWIRIEGDTGTVGITDYAQTQLGDIVFVDLPAVGRVVEAGKDCAVVESVKAASEIYAPVSGRVTAVNEALTDAPQAVNTDPQGEGWFFKLTIADAGQLAGLMDQAGYEAYLAGL